MTDKNKEGLILVPIIFKEIGGTIYAAYGYFSPSATETAGEKIGRLLSKESERKCHKNSDFYGQSGGKVV